MFHKIRTRFLAGGLDYGGSREPLEPSSKEITPSFFIF